MYLAELHGKMSPRAEKQEDILTSHVFSFFKYADRERFLRPFLNNTLGLNISSVDADEAEFHFWPRFEDGTEPDLVLKVGDYYLLFEAKLYSDFAPQTKTSRAQLERELDEGQKEAHSYQKAFKLIALTRDHLEKREKFAGIPDDCFCWLNWQSIAFFIYECLQDINITKQERLFAEDLYRLLDKRNLRNFQGLNHLSKMKIFNQSGKNVFFKAETASYRGAFIGYGQCLTIGRKIIEIKTPLFLKRKFYIITTKGLMSDASTVFFGG